MSMIRRWGFTEIFAHWLLIIGVLINIVTGLPLFDQSLFGFLTPLWQQLYIPYNLTLHIFAAFLLVAAAVIHVASKAVTRKPTEAMLTNKDLSDLGAIMKHWFNSSSKYPELGFHHPGEKAVFWLAAVLGLLMTGASGFIMWLQPSVWLNLAVLIHDLGFVLMTALIAGHFIFALSHTQVLTAMLATGKVPVSWAEQWHPLWARKKIAELKTGPAAAGD
jgi:cytochrome b subunit of formate dehydrogenase